MSPVLRLGSSPQPRTDGSQGVVRWELLEGTVDQT